LVDPLPLPLPPDWEEFVNQSVKPEEIHDIRHCITHDLPFGDEEWKRKLSENYGIECFHKKPGRPKKHQQLQ
jgi:hypothetical protein